VELAATSWSLDEDRSRPLWVAAMLGLGIILCGSLVDQIASGPPAWWTALVAAVVACLVYHCRGLHMRHAQEVTALHMRTIEALALAIGAKDDSTHSHVRRVAHYAEAIARELDLPRDQRDALRAAALLHDVGKLAVPEHILTKPGRLTEEEFEKMKIHTLVGAEILEQAQLPYPAASIVRSHHERWDGRGYPEGLRGEEIPIGARILSVVDSFDALSSDRQYRRAIPPEQAIQVIQRDAGTRYDPRVVAVLERVWRQLESQLQTTPAQETHLSTKVQVKKGDGPQLGLAVEQRDEVAPGLYPIVQARQELQVLYALTQALGNSLSVDETLQLLAVELRKLIPFDSVAVYLIRQGELTARFVEGPSAPQLARLRIPVGEGVSGWVASTGKCSLNGNPAVESGSGERRIPLREFQSALSVPLDSSKGILGVLTLYAAESDAFRIDHVRILKTIGVKAGVAIHNALIHEAIQEFARTDELTGLPNARAAFARLREEVGRASRQRTPLSLFVIDLNGLKKINDTHGHLVGNQVIRAVGGALKGCLRGYDFAARMGGDEFIILLPGMGPESGAEKRLDLRQAIEGLRADFPEIEVSISMGAASYPEDGTDVDRLVAVADRRMYWHKRQRHAARGGAQGELDGLAGVETNLDAAGASPCATL